jgi:hypothetical protein
VCRLGGHCPALEGAITTVTQSRDPYRELAPSGRWAERPPRVLHASGPFCIHVVSVGLISTTLHLPVDFPWMT